jgi:hypothetical protein
MVENQAAQWVLERLGSTEQELPKPRIVSFIPSALQALANKVADPQGKTRQGVRELLRKDFSVSVTSGVGALTTPLTASEPLLLEFARGYLVYNTADTRYPYSYCADKGSLLDDRPLGLGYFTINGTDLLVVTSVGSRTPTATYTVRAPYVPTLALLPGTLDDDFLGVLTEFVKNGGPMPTEEPRG